MRFNSADSAYLSRTPSSAGDRKTWTFSAWIKRSSIGSSIAGDIIGSAVAPSGTNGLYFRFNSDFITFGDYGASGWDWLIETSDLFRDASAWYHIVAQFDTTQSTSTDRAKIYVNGIRVTSFRTTTYPSLNLDGKFNQASVQASIGRLGTYAGDYFSGYMTEINFIDGQALTPDSFGVRDTSTYVWKPKAYSGSYGTNGFYLKFADNSGATSTTLGKDSSGNNNNWTPNNFSVTAGAGNDSLVDSPTNYGTDTGSGGEVRGNYCTLNTLDNGGLTIANGNLDASRATASWASTRATIGVSSGKWYWEITPNSGLSVGSTTNQIMIGIAKPNAPQSPATGTFYNSADGWGYYYNTGDKWNNGSGVSYGATYTNNDVIGVAFDADNGTLVFYKNGVSQGTAFTGLTSGPYFPIHGHFGTASSVANFGQRPFAYTAPSGFKALCTQNLATPTIQKPSKYMDALAYTGTGASNSISSLGFSPDLVWIKNRGTTTDHALYDTTRGTQAQISSNSTAAEVTSSSGLTAFGSAGFTIGTSSLVNTSGTQYVAWSWDAGEATSTNTSGSITSTVRANPQAGVSVVSFVNASGTNQSTVGHGLGSSPKIIIAKNRDTGANNWSVFHSSVCDTTSKFLQLNTTAALITFTTVWGASLPSSSVFGVTGGGIAAASVNMIAYCFAEIEGYSKIGSYTGNGSSDGPFVWCGFRPRYVLIKRTDSTGEWFIWDTARNTLNEMNTYLSARSSQADSTFSGILIDFTSNGFKLRGSYAEQNASSGSYIFAAFAEAPFKYARAR